MKKSVVKSSLVSVFVTVALLATTAIFGVLFFRADTERARQQSMQENTWRELQESLKSQNQREVDARSALFDQKVDLEKKFSAVLEPSTNYQADLDAMVWLQKSENAFSYQVGATIKSPSGKRTLITFQDGAYSTDWSSQKRGIGFFVVENGIPMRKAWFTEMADTGSESIVLVENPRWLNENEIGYTVYGEMMCDNPQGSCSSRASKTLKLQ
jgi:type II secretory pathway pseudopilin PulG